MFKKSIYIIVLGLFAIAQLSSQPNKLATEETSACLPEHSFLFGVGAGLETGYMPTNMLKLSAGVSPFWWCEITANSNVADYPNKSETRLADASVLTKFSLGKNPLAMYFKYRQAFGSPVGQTSFPSVNSNIVGVISRYADEGLDFSAGLAGMLTSGEETDPVQYFWHANAELDYLTGRQYVNFNGDPFYRISLHFAPEIHWSEKSLSFAVSNKYSYWFDRGDMIEITPQIRWEFAHGWYIYSSMRIPVMAGNIFAHHSGIACNFNVAEPEPEKPKEIFEVSLKEIAYYDDFGYYNPLDSITIEEIGYWEVYPLIPYVFFEKNEELIDIHNHETLSGLHSGDFQLSDIEETPLGHNFNNINIIGKRLEDNPSSSVTLTGTNDGRESRLKPVLSKKRSAKIKDYLVSNFDINPDRIDMKFRDLPQHPTGTDEDSDSELGLEENRRVEIESNSWEILAPVVSERKISRRKIPENVIFKPIINSTLAIDKWRLRLSQSGYVFREYGGYGRPDSILWIIRYSELNTNSSPVDYKISIFNVAGQFKDIDGKIPVYSRQRIDRRIDTLPDKTREVFTLLQFDFDKAELSEYDSTVIKEYIAQSIKPQSTVRIYGYTDKIGDSRYNMQLSRARAENVRKILEQNSEAAIYKVFGFGEDVELYPNDIAIGRQLSRCVRVIIETPNY